MSDKRFNQKSRKQTMKKVTITAKWSVELPETPYGPIRKTRKHRKNKINEFLDYLSGFCMFPDSIRTYSPLQIVLNNPKIRKLYFRQKRPLSFVDFVSLLSYNEVMSPTMELCINEFLVFLSELQIAGYSGAARTLRYILETAVEACEFQTQGNRPTFGLLLTEHSSFATLPKKKRKLHSLLLKYNAWTAFMERYKIYKKTKRIAPTFREEVNNLNSRQLFQEAPHVSEELKNTYEVLSDYVHPSSAKFESAIEHKKPSLPRFDPKEFDIIYELGLKTLDIVQFLYLESMAFFFDFKTGKKFLEHYARLYRFPSKRGTLFLKLQFSRHISEGIELKINNETKSKKSKKSGEEN